MKVKKLKEQTIKGLKKVEKEKPKKFKRIGFKI